MNGNKKTSALNIGLLAAAFIVGIILASAFWYFYNNSVIQNISAQIKPLRQSNNSYSFINPLLGYEVPGNIKEFNNYKPLASKINTAVSGLKDPSLDSFSVYFRDLTLGRWMGINQDVAYAPGSMMKVAVMITYFAEAQNNPAILEQKLQYSSSTVDQINGVPFSSPSDLKVGQSYTVEQLIESMIIKSDNGAKDVLLSNINSNSFVDVHTDLGLPNPITTQDYTITPKQYSILLRVLYNATYLRRQYSEKALQILSEAEYNQGLVAGVPKGIAVAQKFGEAIDNSNPNTPKIVLSNCGVIYHQTHPYILCVMAKGTDVTALAKTISTISSTVWQEVDSYSK